jgi:hypothetical protein
MRVVSRRTDPGLMLWAAVAGIAIGFLLSEIVFGARAARLEAELAALHEGDPTGARD